MLRNECNAMLCYATLRCATLRCATLRYATLRCATLRCATLRYAMLRYATLRYATLGVPPRAQEGDVRAAVVAVPPEGAACHRWAATPGEAGARPGASPGAEELPRPVSDGASCAGSSPLTSLSSLAQGPPPHSLA